ncbi:hypothetical protein ASG33_15915 [Dyadobacter sp. Leaf189]|nr:hypothetical protein ASG33_15915 [Dyadobacter sp. Leaf189]
MSLISFDVRSEENGIRLIWKTSEEINSKYFEMQHSADGKGWLSFGTVTSAGESSIGRPYEFFHDKPVSGSNYYRLKMVDNDGSFAYSDIKQIKISSPTHGRLFPNPNAGLLSLDHQTTSDAASIEVFTLTGRSIFVTSMISSDGIRLNNVPDGSYVVKVVKKDSSSFTRKLLVERH